MVCSSSVIWNHAGLDTATGHKLTQVSTQPQVSRLDLARTDQDADTSHSAGKRTAPRKRCERLGWISDLSVRHNAVYITFQDIYIYNTKDHVLCIY